MPTLDEDSVAVAVLGPPDSIQDLLNLAPQFPRLEAVACTYENEEDAVTVYQRIPDHCRAILFTGPLPYYRVLEAVTPRLPVAFVPFDDEALYRTLFYARDRHDITRVSVDTVPRQRVLETYQDLGLRADHVYGLEYRTAIRRSDFVSFHRNHLEAGHTSVALTCLRTAHLELMALGLPCERIVPPPSVLLKSLEKAYLLAQNLRVSENQIAVAVLDLSEALADARQGRTEYDLQRLRLQLQGELMEYAAELDGYLAPSGADEFLLITTQGPVLRATNNLTTAPFLDRLQTIPSQMARLGLGMGATAAEAGEHARLALSHARKSEGGACFVVLSDRRVVGPLGGDRLALPTRNIHPAFVEMAEKAGLSPVTLERVVRVARALKGRGFTAHDLASQLRIAPRSARRLCRVLASAGLITEVGVEAPAPLGRPRSVFELDDSLRHS